MSKRIKKLLVLLAALVLVSFLAILFLRGSTGDFFTLDRLVDAHKLVSSPIRDLLGVTFSADASMYLLTTYHEIVLLSSKDDSIIARFENLRPFHHSVISGDMKVLAVRTYDVGIRVFSVTQGKQLSILDDQIGKGYGVALSHDGALLASCRAGEGLAIWDTQVAKKIASYFGLKQPEVATFSSDGKLLAVGGDGGEVVVLDTTTWLPLAQLKMAGFASVTCIGFNSDGGMLYSGGGHTWSKGGEGGENVGVVNVWRRSDWSELYGNTNPGGVTDVGLSADCKNLVIGRNQGQWDVHDLERGMVLWQGSMEFTKDSRGGTTFSISKDARSLLGYGSIKSGIGSVYIWRWCPPANK